MKDSYQQFNKRIKKIIYVSCNPETLARDIAYLSDFYKVTYVQPVDMFPMTAHVETVACLRLKGRPKPPNIA